MNSKVLKRRCQIWMEMKVFIKDSYKRGLKSCALGGWAVLESAEVLSYPL